MPIKVDPIIMQELLDSDGVREQVREMAPEMLEWFKKLLVKEGIYQRFVLEKQAAQLEQAKARKR